MVEQLDIVIPGYLFCDLIFRGLPDLPSLGEEIFGSRLDIAVGGVYNTAITLKRLGLSIGLISDLGTDTFSELISATLHAEGISDRYIRYHNGPLPTVTAVLSFPSDRAFVSYMEKQSDRESFFAPVTKDTVKLVHLPGLKEIFNSRDLLAQAKAEGVPITADCQWHPDLIQTPEIWDFLRLIDIFLPNDKEAMMLTRTSSVQEALDKLAEITPCVIIKMGNQGAIGRTATETVHLPALPVETVDSTGAGDSFNAGFLYAYLQGYDLRTMLAYGNICGGLSVTAAGGGTIVVTRDTIGAHLHYYSLHHKS